MGLNSKVANRGDIEEDTGITFTGAEVRAAVKAATDLPFMIAQTGGGVATVYIGEDVEVGAYGRVFRLAVGPGTFNWENPDDSTFYAEDFSIGPDDWGERPSTIVTTLDELTEATRALLALPDWRDDAR